MLRRNFLKLLGFGAVATVCPKAIKDSIPTRKLANFTPLLDRNRKLKAVWSMESQQDLRAWHAMDAEKDLTELMTKELLKELA